MCHAPDERKRGRTDVLRSVGAVVSSCTGAGGAATIATVHGSTTVALTTFAIMQLWGLCEFAVRWHFKLRSTRLQEWLVKKAAEQPDDEGLRALLGVSVRIFQGQVADELQRPSARSLTTRSRSR
jgi:hypothetical protein